MPLPVVSKLQQGVYNLGGGTEIMYKKNKFIKEKIVRWQMESSVVSWFVPTDLELKDILLLR